MDFFTVKPRPGIDWHAPATAPESDTCRIASQNGLFRLAKQAVLACETGHFGSRNEPFGNALVVNALCRLPHFAPVKLKTLMPSGLHSH